MSLEKLKNSPLRRGRGNTTDEARQMQDESVERDELLRVAVLDLCTIIDGIKAEIAEINTELADLGERLLAVEAQV